MVLASEPRPSSPLALLRPSARLPPSPSGSLGVARPRHSVPDENLPSAFELQPRSPLSSPALTSYPAIPSSSRSPLPEPFPPSVAALSARRLASVSASASASASPPLLPRPLSSSPSHSPSPSPSPSPPHSPLHPPVPLSTFFRTPYTLHSPLSSTSLRFSNSSHSPSALGPPSILHPRLPPPRPSPIGASLRREPSLAGLMSRPPTGPSSPDRHAPLLDSTATRKSSLPFRQCPLSNQASHGHFASPQLNRTSVHRSAHWPPNRLFTNVPTTLCCSQSSQQTGLCHLQSTDGSLKHYERVRSPSLRGFSRADKAPSFHSLQRSSGLLSPSTSNLSPQAPLLPDTFDFDLSDDIGEETFRRAHASEAAFDHLDGLRLDEEDDEEDDDQGRAVFSLGERLGVGTCHQGHRVRDLFEAGDGDGRRLSMSSSGGSWGSGLLEIVREIGVGSYAVVYLVREVIYDPDLDPTPSESSLSQTPRASDGFAMLNTFPEQPSTVTLRRKRDSSQIVYGKDFALKCLCKSNLSPELLVLQRGEAELHRNLPLHDNIVALYRALETPNWLFLVIEYCPGQDLFYWLEQARDSQDLDSFSSRTSSPSVHLPCIATSQQVSTRLPRVPSSCTDETSISPNTPPSPSLLASTADDEMLSRRRLRLISRMFVQMCDAVQACHAVGVCHRDIKPENFIVVDDRCSKRVCSSATPSSVIVKITDWGLGTSLSSCEDFDCGSKPYMAYECRNNLSPAYDPQQADVWSLGIVLLNLLYHRCPWADPSGSDHDFNEFRQEPVRFLHNRFEGMTASVAEFLATRVFCEVGVDGHQPSTRVSAGEFGVWARDLVRHMGGGQSHASFSAATIAMSPSSARSGAENRGSVRSSYAGQLPKALPYQSLNVFGIVPESSEDLSAKDPSKYIRCGEGPLQLTDSPLEQNTQDLTSPVEIVRDAKDFEAAVEENEPVLGQSVKVLAEVAQPGCDGEEVNGSSDKAVSDRQARRRKRGARKSKRSGFGTAPASPLVGPARVDDVLDGLAEASQSLAREISMATKTNHRSGAASSLGPGKRKVNLAERMLEKFRDGSNPDLQAFVARAKARDAALMGAGHSNVNSAPAQMQNAKRLSPGWGSGSLSCASAGLTTSHAVLSSASSSGVTTMGSLSSWGGGATTGSASELSTCSKAAHWNSAASRRERISKTTTTLPQLGLPLQPSLDLQHSQQVRQAMKKKEESKNKLASLLTSFKRFNSTVGGQQALQSQRPGEVNGPGETPDSSDVNGTSHSTHPTSLNSHGQTAGEVITVAQFSS